MTKPFFVALCLAAFSVYGCAQGSHETSDPGPSGPSSTTAGGHGGQAGAGGGGGGGSAQVEPPSVVSISPEDGEVGVAADSPIVIVFSRPMDQAATEAAYQSSDIPPEGASFTWSTLGQVLTIVPDSPLAYASGDDPGAVLANEYAFSIETGARDENGVALATQVSSSFFTLREISQTLAADIATSGHVRADGNPGGCTSPASDICAGDSGSPPNLQYKGFVSFDISELPDAISEITLASLESQQIAVYGNPYASLGTVGIEHVTFAAVDTLAFNTAPLASIGIFSSSASLGQRTALVTPYLADDYAGSRPRSQYRFAFTMSTNANSTQDAAVFSTAATSLHMTYLLP